ncbi:MAG TPA: hypothetical protein PK199_07495 [Bacteroidales bacterium]|nr:hypothetical protein [Bacteroidales bacterium]
MSQQSIDIEFLHYFTMLNDSQKKSLLQLVKTFAIKKNQISIADYNAELEAAEKRIAKGAYTTHSDLENEARLW